MTLTKRHGICVMTATVLASLAYVALTPGKPVPIGATVDRSVGFGFGTGTTEACAKVAVAVSPNFAAIEANGVDLARPVTQQAATAACATAKDPTVTMFLPKG